PLLFAMQDQETKTKVTNILSKPKITNNDVATLVDFTLEAKSVVELKNQMRLLSGEGSNLTIKLPKPKLRSQLQVLLSFMLEDL
ncbi:MAG TPA: hypothetical protein VMW84_02895, partial [Acidobacteriota bacterium]|nr:hypothetical protein [Acidobacteriota bacterium]